jgi:hypothetical protein
LEEILFPDDTMAGGVLLAVIKNSTSQNNKQSMIIAQYLVKLIKSLHKLFIMIKQFLLYQIIGISFVCL